MKHSLHTTDEALVTCVQLSEHIYTHKCEKSFCLLHNQCYTQMGETHITHPLKHFSHKFSYHTFKFHIFIDSVTIWSFLHLCAVILNAIVENNCNSTIEKR